MLLAKHENRWLTTLETPKTLLTLGVLVRVLTFCFLNPANNDDHFSVIQLLVAEVGQEYVGAEPGFRPQVLVLDPEEDPQPAPEDL